MELKKGNLKRKKKKETNFLLKSRHSSIKLFKTELKDCDKKTEKGLAPLLGPRLS